MSESLIIKPHHFLDIIRDFGAGIKHEPHPYGHAVHEAAQRLHENPECLLELTSGVDSICQPCRNLVGGHCTDTTSTPGRLVSKESWNLLIDSRLFERLGLKEGDRLTARQFCRIALARLGDIYSIYPEVAREKTAWREQNLLSGLKEYLGSGENGHK